MPKEKVIYRFRYEDPAYERKKIPYLDRRVQLLREVHYAASIRSYQVLDRCTILDQLALEEYLKCKFPQRVRGNQQDTLGRIILDWLRICKEMD